MEKLLWVGKSYFAGELEDCGWGTVHIHDFDGQAAFSWKDLTRIAGFEPDVLVVSDMSRPPFVLGMEEFPCVTVFYSVDAHIHSWHPYYAQGFDACLVSLRDYLPKFGGPFLPESRIWWSPPFASRKDMPKPDVAKDIDCLFVGNLDGNLMPKRKKFLDELGEKVPSLITMQGDYRSAFPRARVVVNQAENDDMNFRIFEAMGCGACLLTPRINHGLQQMFVDGEHLLFYPPGDAGDAAYKIEFIKKHPEIGEHIGREALKIIDAEHRAQHRAQAFTDHMCDLFTEGADNIIAKRKSDAKKIRTECLSLPYLLWANEIDDAPLRQAYLAAAKGDFGLDGFSALH